MKSLLKNVELRMVKAFYSVRRIMLDNSGQGALETAITILIAVVLGALLLAGLYALFSTLILPTLSDKIRDMFNYTN